MKKRKWKALTVPALASTLVLTGVVPGTAWAAEVSQKSSVQISQQKNGQNTLSPEHFNELIKTAATQISSLDLYAKKVQSQPDFNLTNAGLTDSLRNKIINDQQQARSNVGAWRNTVKPQIIQTTQNIFSFGIKFNNYYQTMIQAADAKNKKTLVSGLGLLRQQVQHNQQATKDLIVVLQNFRNHLATDGQNFSNDSQEVLKVSGNQQEYMKRLDDLIKQAESDIAQGMDLMKMGAAIEGEGIFHQLIGWFKTFFDIMGDDGASEWAQGLINSTEGGMMIKQGAEMYDKGKENKKKASIELGSVQSNYETLSVAKNELGTLITEIDKAIGFAQTLVNQWNDMDNRYDSLISDINDVNTDDLTFVKEDLYTAKLSWNAIEQQAGYLNNLD